LIPIPLYPVGYPYCYRRAMNLRHVHNDPSKPYQPTQTAQRRRAAVGTALVRMRKGAGIVEREGEARMVWGRSRIREQEVADFSGWLEGITATAAPKAAEEYLFDLLNAPDFGAVGRRARAIVAALPTGQPASAATVADIIDQLDRELASEQFSAVAQRVKQRLLTTDD